MMSFERFRFAAAAGRASPSARVPVSGAKGGDGEGSRKFSRRSHSAASTREGERTAMNARVGDEGEGLTAGKRSRPGGGGEAEAPVTPAPKKRTGTGSETESGPRAAAADAEADAVVRRYPFIAPHPAKWRERYAPVCASCEAARLPCLHHPEKPLKLLVIGHNPSNHSWASGFSYSNPSNQFWKLLVKGGIVPDQWTVEDCPRLGDFLVALRFFFSSESAAAARSATLRTPESPHPIAGRLACAHDPRSEQVALPGDNFVAHPS